MSELSDCYDRISWPFVTAESLRRPGAVRNRAVQPWVRMVFEGTFIGYVLGK